MKNTKITLVAITTLFVASCSSMQSRGQGDDSKTVANYKYGEITKNQVDREMQKIAAKNPKLKDVTFDALNADQQEAVIKEVALNEFFYRKAKQKGLDKDADYKTALKIFETEVLKQKLLIQLAKDAKEEENLRQNYDEIIADLANKKDYKISYIALKTKKKADYVHRKVTKYPKSFAYHARTKSIDKETAKKGGTLGFVLEDSLPQKILETVKDLSKNQISTPISLGGKWIVVKFEDVRPAQAFAFEDSKEELAKSLALKAQKDFIAKSLKEADISISLN